MSDNSREADKLEAIIHDALWTGKVKASEAQVALDRLAALAAQAAPVQAVKTGACANKRLPGGCPLHNLHCGYPKCDEVATPSAAPQQAGETHAADVWEPGTWFKAATVDDMQAFFRARLPAIREAAREHGYAIGVHGSERRDFDLMAMPWREGASDAETLAHAVAKAAVGIGRAGPYQWETKPAGRVATCIPICWTSRHDVPSDGHIDLSVMPALARPAADAAVAEGLAEALRKILKAVDNASGVNLGESRWEHLWYDPELRAARAALATYNTTKEQSREAKGGQE